MKKLILLWLVLSMLLVPASGIVAAPRGQGSGTTYLVTIEVTQKADLKILWQLGVRPDKASEDTVSTIITHEQLRALQARGFTLHIEATYTSPAIAPSPVSALDLSNSDLYLDIASDGRFSLYAADGRQLTYAGAWSSYLSVKVDSNIYNNNDGSLTVTTPLTQVDQNNAYLIYTIPGNVVITQWFTLSGKAARFRIDVTNNDSSSHAVSVRYLIDTMVDINDGSPLYAPGVGVRTYETDLPNPTFTTWMGYDQYPNPTLTSVGTLSGQTSRVVFAWWPNAYDYTWDYTPDPNQRFYTPGYTYSPYSDSCVLVYLPVGNLAPGSNNMVSSYYGIGAPTPEDPRTRLIAALDQLHDVTISAVDSYAQTYAEMNTDAYIALEKEPFMEAFKTIVTIASLGFPSNAAAAVGEQWARALDPLSKILKFTVSPATRITNWHLVWEYLADNIPDERTSDRGWIIAFMRDGLDGSLAGQPEDRKFLFNGKRGLTAVRQGMAEKHNQVVDQLRLNPLPANYPVDMVVKQIDREIGAITESETGHSDVGWYSGQACQFAPLGSLISQKSRVEEVVSSYETIDKVSTLATILQAGALGYKLKCGGITILSVGQSAPITVPCFGAAEVFLLASGIASGLANISDVAGKYYLGSLIGEAQLSLQEDVRLLQRIHSDTHDWVSYLIQQSSALSLAASQVAQAGFNLQVLDVDTPNIVVGAGQIGGIQTGTVDIKNNGPMNVRVTVYARMTGPIVENGLPFVNFAGSIVYTEIPAGATIPISFDYYAIRSSLMDRTGYDVQLYLGLTDPDGNSMDILGPIHSHFYVGTQEQLSNLGTQTVEAPISGTLSTGQIYSETVSTQSSTRTVRLTLAAASGSDLDLHLYDSSGNHVGLNYDTGLSETSIPGSGYSGSTVSPEWIEVSPAAGQQYTVSVVAMNTAGGGGYSISMIESPQFPALMDTSPQITLRTYSRNPSFSFNVREYGGYEDINNLQATPSSLSDGEGHVIPASSVTLSVPSTTIAAGTTLSIGEAISVPTGTPEGTYSGSIQIMGNDASSGAPLVATTTISLTLSDYKIYLPIILKNY